MTDQPDSENTRGDDLHRLHVIEETKRALDANSRISRKRRLQQASDQMSAASASGYGLKGEPSREAEPREEAPRPRPTTRQQGQGPGSRASRKLKDHRRRIIRQYMKQNEIQTIEQFARCMRHKDKTAIEGMVRSDRKRYSETTLDRVLAKIGCRREGWDHLPNGS